MSFEEFQAGLLNHEVVLGHHQESQQPPFAESRNFALYSHKPGPFNNNYSKGKLEGYHKNNSQPKYLGNYPKNQSNFSGGYPHNTYQQSNPKCFGNNSVSKPSILDTTSHLTPMKAPYQICEKLGHQALDYIHRMNFAYQGKTPPSQLSTTVARVHHKATTQDDEHP